MTPDAGKARVRRRGDAGRDASSARARRHLVGIRPMLDAIMQDVGWSAASIAPELTRRGVRKPRGGAVWTPADVLRLMRRLGMDGRR